MLKNDIRIIIRRVIIAIVVAMVLCFLRDIKVLAAELTPTTTQFDARYSNDFATIDSNLPGGRASMYLTSLGTYQGTVNMGNAITKPDGTPTYALTQLSLKYSYTTGNGFVAGNTYNFKLRVNVSNEEFPSFAKSHFVLVNTKGGASTSALDTANIQASTLQKIELDPDNDKVFYLYISMVPAVNVKYVWFYVGYEKAPITFMYNSTQDYRNGNVVVRNSGVSYSEGTNAYIQQTTNAVLQQTAEILKIFNLDKDEYDYLTDDTDAAVDVSGMSDITGILPPGPIDSVLALPLYIINKFIYYTGVECSPLSFTFVWDMPITLPCFDAVFWSQINNMFIYIFLNDLPAALLFMMWCKSLYKRVERATSFESTTDDAWGGV